MGYLSPSASILAEQVQKLKTTNSGVITNLFLSADEVRKTLASKDCCLYGTEGALILSVPYFQRYYDIHYVAATSQDLSMALVSFRESCPDGHTLRISVVGRDEDTGETVNALREAGFTQIVRLARMRLKKPKPSVINSMRSLVAEQGEEERFLPRFARDEDAEDIYRLLAAEFDFCSDSLPEMADVRQHIQDKQVVVIADDGKIVCAHYFDVKNNIYYGRFDVTAKEYRRKFLFFRISLFMYDEAETGKHPPYRRLYGWRNIKEKSLMKFAALNDQIKDGIYITNMIWSRNGMEMHHATS